MTSLASIIFGVAVEITALVTTGGVSKGERASKKNEKLLNQPN